MKPSGAEAAVAAITAFAANIVGHECADCTVEPVELNLSETDAFWLAGVGGLLVVRLGQPARELLAEFGLQAARSAERRADQ